MQTELDKALKAAHEQFEAMQEMDSELYKADCQYVLERSILLDKRNAALEKLKELDAQVVACATKIQQ